jgi:hypothetical protein
MDESIEENSEEIAELEILEAALLSDMEEILTANPAMNEPLPKFVSKHVSINSFTDEEICSNFRFRISYRCIDCAKVSNFIIVHL